MYLKSLVLKGFKSFADRSVLTLEPGVTAVVGPNGSGKSNISDAVLWVLGERNAKHLRGQAMEDVVFAGSSARKAAGLAEVDLVLDNSDGMLPVEYGEVVITRRMYRNGESEYLINGTQARRMDVLDILHDSGLGTGTHSIISQGSLDSILQSSPDDRRALIEEAAGTLKHKQRKARSERKLQQMDAHLDRAKDIAREVERQLAPLERKAKRARVYEELSAELSELSLALAVDDLRLLQQAWNDADQREKAASAELESLRESVAQAEARAESLQERVRREAADAGELARTHGRASSAVERIDGAALLLREKLRAARDAQVSLADELERSCAERDQASAGLSQAQDQRAEAAASREQAEAQAARLQDEQAENVRCRRALEADSEAAERERKAAERDQDELRRRLARTQEALASGLAHMRLAEGHEADRQGQLERARDEAERQEAAAVEAERARDEAERQEAAARAAAAEALKRREEAQATLAAARAEEARCSAAVKGLEEVERASASANPARAWVQDRMTSLAGRPAPLSHAVRVEEGLEPLVEGLLGADIAAVLVDDPQAAALAAGAVQGSGQQGEVAFLAREDCARREARVREAAASCGGWALIDRISCESEARAAVCALLGDVVVCDSLDAALAAHATCDNPLRFVTPLGCVVWPQGKVSTGSAVSDDEAGVLARIRALDKARATFEQAKCAREDAEQHLQQAEKVLSELQAESLRAARNQAGLRGAAESARSDARRAREKLASVRQELEDARRQREDAERAVLEAKPSVEQLEGSLAQADERLKAARAAFDQAQESVVPLRKEAARLRDALADAKLEAARLAEREAYAARLVDARRNDISQLDHAQAASRDALARKSAAEHRAAPLLAVFEELARLLRGRVRGIEQAMAQASDVSSELRVQADVARAQAKAAHDSFNAASARLSEEKVGKGKLEVQVETAVTTVVKEYATPLDRALTLPPLEDRGQAEEKAFKLRRRIANMGSVSSDAASEYEQVKQRYDYLSAQLADLEGARRSLARIVALIDARMRDDFMRTYEAVDRNFQEIFSVLFPGGSAHLSLLGAEDPDTAGVEVSAQPRGKRIAKMTLMSGGEKSLTALALLFAVYRTRATPFYLLDEVEAALDDSNLRRLIAYLQTLRESTQLIMITHQRRTMEMADVLFGVSMQADGVTKVISQRLDQALRHAE